MNLAEAKIRVEPEFAGIQLRNCVARHGFCLESSSCISADSGQKIIFKPLQICTPFLRQNVLPEESHAVIFFRRGEYARSAEHADDNWRG
jgi:hypothetical protein